MVVSAGSDRALSAVFEVVTTSTSNPYALNPARNPAEPRCGSSEMEKKRHTMSKHTLPLYLVAIEAEAGSLR
jgi:hypothetical protein